MGGLGLDFLFREVSIWGTADPPQLTSKSEVGSSQNHPAKIFQTFSVLGNSFIGILFSFGPRHDSRTCQTGRLKSDQTFKNLTKTVLIKICGFQKSIFDTLSCCKIFKTIGTNFCGQSCKASIIVYHHY